MQAALLSTLSIHMPASVVQNLAPLIKEYTGREYLTVEQLQSILARGVSSGTTIPGLVHLDPYVHRELLDKFQDKHVQVGCCPNSTQHQTHCEFLLRREVYNECVEPTCQQEISGQVDASGLCSTCLAPRLTAMTNIPQRMVMCNYCRTHMMVMNAHQHTCPQKLLSVREEVERTALLDEVRVDIYKKEVRERKQKRKLEEHKEHEERKGHEEHDKPSDGRDDDAHYAKRLQIEYDAEFARNLYY